MKKLYLLDYRMWATGEFSFSLQHSVPYHDSGGGAGRVLFLFFFNRIIIYIQILSVQFDEF